MTSREIIKAVLDFSGAPRIGRTFPEPYGSDMMHRGAQFARSTPLEPRGHELKRWRDEWGVVWASLTDFDKGEVVAGAIPDWKNLDNYCPPDLGNPVDYARAAADFAAEGDKFRVGGVPGFTFNIARKLRRLEDYLCDLMLERAKVDKLHALVRTELLKCIDQWGRTQADAIMFPEDWGTQDRLMVSPAMWREIFKPEFKVLAARAHDYGKKVLMHSCGKITAIIPDLIECGIDCLQFDQPRLHGLDALAAHAGQVAFWCPVDIQKTLQTRRADLIEAEARELVARLFVRGGGFIAGYYGGNQAIGLTPDVQDIACRAFMACGG